MERKIGEIFELGGEWYQCIIGHCNQCSFDEAGTCKFIGNPYCAYRNDKKLACFKKLEKVGEPYELNSHLVQKYRFFHNPAIQVNGICILETINTDKIIEIGIKQTKKDMEDLDKIKVRDYTKVEELNVMEEKKLNLKSIRKKDIGLFPKEIVVTYLVSFGQKFHGKMRNQENLF